MKDNTIGNQQVTETDIAWLAGIYDGEGWFSLKPKRANMNFPEGGINLSIGIVNTDSNIINKVDWILSELDIPHYIREKSQTKNWKTRYDVEIKKFSSAKMVLERVLPYLVAKTGQANLLLRFVNRRLDLPKNSKYSADDIEIINEYKENYARCSGTSTTIREGATKAIAA